MQEFLHAFSRTTCRQQIFHFDDCKARKEMRKDRGRTISTIRCGRLRWSYQDDEFWEQAESWEGMLWLLIRYYYYYIHLYVAPGGAQCMTFQNRHCKLIHEFPGTTG